MGVASSRLLLWSAAIFLPLYVIGKEKLRLCADAAIPRARPMGVLVEGLGAAKLQHFSIMCGGRIAGAVTSHHIAAIVQDVLRRRRLFSNVFRLQH
ncbi:hypothetical protein JQ628_32810 [Bradyrhizobium lablabi]|uniref:hypothetical protein n=1 Tax=Bradyrhizobium lablabi TaxID=722472 RepID=UPI001BA6048B|nr:hypothetical protein [Bradyrhizobium lablabi]MBR1126340.1 hypothetical protein [Bradyrhizobium lablabi]